MGRIGCTSQCFPFCLFLCFLCDIPFGHAVMQLLAWNPKRLLFLAYGMERRVRRLPLMPKKMFSVWNIMAMPAAPFLFWVRGVLGYLLYRVRKQDACPVGNGILRGLNWAALARAAHCCPLFYFLWDILLIEGKTAILCGRFLLQRNNAGHFSTQGLQEQTSYVNVPKAGGATVET